MSAHPVQLQIERPTRASRLHVGVRLALMLAIAAFGCSSIYWVVYLALPAFAALVVARKGGAVALAENGPPAVRALRWLAAAYAYLWLLTDEPPASGHGGPVDLRIDFTGVPTPGSALLRLVYSLPALVVLCLLSVAAGVMWLIGAVWVLVTERLPGPVGDFLALTLRYQFRLVAYHLSLVDRYPSFEESRLQSVAPGGVA
jgi:hypothetical protein